MGFISLLLTIGQKYIAQICIPKSIAESMRPCSAAELKKFYPPKKGSSKGDDEENSGRKLLELAETFIPRRSLAKGYDTCADKVNNSL